MAGIGAITTTVSILIVVLNTLVLASFVLFGSLREKAADYLILNLSITDLLLGLLVLPFSIVHKLSGSWYFGPLACKFWQSFDICLCVQSVWAAMLLSIDKYLYVAYPLRYISMVTTQRLCIGVLISWCVAFAFAFLPNMTNASVDVEIQSSLPPELCVYVLNTAYALAAFFVNFFCPFLVILFTNYRIYRAVKHQTRRIRQLQVLERTSASGNSGTQPDAPFLSKSEIKAIKITGVLIGSLVIMWLPLFVTLVIDTICHCVDPVIFETVNWLGYCNSMCNPLLYACNTNYRTAYKRILCCDLNSPRPEDSQNAGVVPLPRQNRRD
ncbi:beta-4C adrenergic receptor-like [Ptychodera flava]|uniref:beta-4C adrenergic receptor-like n=1 Tax=Ptychodera flava TaxID=63121 RepID=UPI00396A9528